MQFLPDGLMHETERSVSCIDRAKSGALQKVVEIQGAGWPASLAEGK